MELESLDVGMLDQLAGVPGDLVQVRRAGIEGSEHAGESVGKFVR